MPSPDCSVLKCIALTYDDGPDPTTTPQLLDVLGRENVTATMFLIGKNAQAHPELVIRERDLGLQIGNHTMTHPTLSKQPAEVVTDELTQTQTVLSTITGVTPTVMRPPYAARNATTDEISGQLGLAVVTWDSSPVDWENKDASTIHALTVQGASPGAIILMHDTHQWTVDAAAPIIADLKAQGYTFVTVSQLLGATTPGQLYPSH
jgi:peptidoglycan/xylan/chitin deacetylase (PgdA/CDA1 family)